MCPEKVRMKKWLAILSKQIFHCVFPKFQRQSKWAIYYPFDLNAEHLWGI